MWLFIGRAFWFILPAGIANITASLSRYIPWLNYPVDFGRHYRGKRLFGDHKTWRGIVFGTLVGLLFFWLQQCLYKFGFFQEISLFDYSQADWLTGFLLASGAVWGDVVKSFFKRQVNIAPGRPWIPFDQVDYTLGAIILTSLIYFPGWGTAVFIVIFGFVLHILFNLIGYVLRLQRNKL
jgi:CDP-2,3-bis-(O-geranylgeranyl)-sn-glycerol synthase